MTKEELKQEAEEWLCNNLHSASEEDFIKAMVDIAEPREKRIAELTDELKALRESIKDYGAGCYENGLRNGKRKLEAQIAELEKENAELKKLKRECETSLCRAEYQYNYEQLTKAKEIIREFVEWATWQGSNCPNFKSIQDKAEQFLKESE